MEQSNNDQRPKSDILRLIHGFRPSSFAAITGTGAISILLRTAQHKFPGMATVGTVFYFANIFLLVLFTLITAAQVVLFPWSMVRMLRNQSQSLYLGAVPMGLATIVSGTVLVAVPAHEWAVDLSWALWWVDVLLTVLNVFGLPLIMAHMQENAGESMTATWLLPVVPAIVTAASGGLVATVLPHAHAVITIVVSYALWGIGMGLSFFVLAQHFYHSSMRHLSSPEAMISAYLPLVPCGQGAYAIIELALAGRNTLSVTGLPDAGDVVLVVSTIVALIIWGLGLWWLVHGTVTILLIMITDTFKPNMRWWGFVFPLGVFVSATIKLGEEVPSAFLVYLSLVMLAGVFILYIIVASVSLKAICNRVMLDVSSDTSSQSSSIKSSVLLPEPLADLSNSAMSSQLAANSGQPCNTRDDST